MSARYRHKEAFALMWYACECGHRERIWNSRDGVTPFGLSCTSCGTANLRHVDWHLDQHTPEHCLFKGQRFWRDGTADEAIAIIERRIERFAEAGRPVPDEIAKRLLRDARLLSGEWQAGWPALDVFDGDHKKVQTHG